MRSRATIPRRCDGFSLVELLVALALVATLAGLLLVVAGPILRRSKTEKTRAILVAVRKGIELTIAAKGGAIAPAEHPFAGSRRPVGAAGFRFLGLRGRSPPDGAAAGARWIPILPAGPAQTASAAPASSGP